MNPSKPKLAGIVLILALVGLFAALRFVEVYRRSAMTYRLQVTYGTLPLDDKALESWLLGLPGIRSAEVRREQSTLRLNFNLSDPQPLDPLGMVLLHAKSLGYQDCLTYGGQFSRIRAYDFSTLRAEFDAMPASDAPLVAWLRSNPALTRSTVAREGKFLSIEFAMKDPPVPTMLADILKQCRMLGYGTEKGHISGFGPYH